MIQIVTYGVYCYEKDIVFLLVPFCHEIFHGGMVIFPIIKMSKLRLLAEYLFTITLE